MSKTIFIAPEGQRYSCQKCRVCCHGWLVSVTKAERGRLLNHDWAGESPRLAGIPLFQEMPAQNGTMICVTRIEGRCAFLEDDDLCLIHRVQGFEAKPIACQLFPLRLVHTVDGLQVACSYACSSLVRNVGAPLAAQERFIRALLEDSHEELGELINSRGGLPLPTEPVLDGNTRMTWQSYRATERSILSILANRQYPVTRRLVAALELVSMLSKLWAGRERIPDAEIVAWLDEAGRSGYAGAFDRAEPLPEVTPMRQRAVLAPLITYVETALGAIADPSVVVTGYPASILKGMGEVGLSSLQGQLDLGAMERVRFNQDSYQFDDYLTRFLSNFVLRKSLLESPTLRDGCNYLAVCFALVRWYSIASTALRDGLEVDASDLVEGIRVVDKAYSQNRWIRGLAGKTLLNHGLADPAAIVERSALRRKPER